MTCPIECPSVAKVGCGACGGPTCLDHSEFCYACSWHSIVDAPCYCAGACADSALWKCDGDRVHFGNARFCRAHLRSCPECAADDASLRWYYNYCEFCECLVHPRGDPETERRAPPKKRRVDPDEE